MKLHHSLHTHLKQHHKKYLGGLFAGFAVVKTFVLLAGFLGITNLVSTFAAGGEVNSGNIVTEYGCATDANFCDLSNKGINSIAPDTFVNHTNLQQLNLNYNQLTTIDLSGLTGLTNLWLGSNQLSSIDLSGLTGLTNLDLNNNQLSSIDLSGLTSLQRLYLNNNQLSSIDLSGLTELTNLGLGSNQLSSIDLSGLTGLTNLDLNNNQLSSIDLSGLTGLTYLGLGSNQLSSIDLSGLTALNYLYLSRDNQLTEIDLSGLTELTSLGLGGNSLTEIDLSELHKLIRVELAYNQLTSIDLSGLTALNYLYLDHNQLSSINLSGLTGLATLQIHNNLLSTLPDDLINNERLQTGQLNLYYNRISTGGLSPALISFIDARHTTSEGDWKIKQILPFTSCAEMIDISESECEALVDLYHSTNGSGWTVQSGWLVDNSVCDDNRYGVSCRFDHITNLSLDSNNLSGTADLSGLPFLSKINFNFNANLRLDLSTLSGCTGLQKINMYSVKTYGDIVILSDMKNLVEIRLFGGSSNHIYGNIDALSGATNLEKLWITNTDIEGTLDSLSRLTGLVSLAIGGNKLTGTIPADFATTMANITNDESIANDISNNFLDTQQSYDPDLVVFLDTMFAGWKNQRALADMAITSDITSLTGEIGAYLGFPILYTNNGPQDISGAQIFVQTTGVDITGYDAAGYIGREYGIVGDSCYDEFISDASSGVYYAGLDQIFSGMGLPDFYYFAQNFSYIYETNNPEMNYDGGRHETEGQWFMWLCSSMLQVDTLSECLSMFGLMTHQDISLAAIGGNVCGMGGTFGYFYNLSPLSNGMSGLLIITGALLTDYTTGEIVVSTYTPTIIDDITGNNILSLSLFAPGSEPLLPVCGNGQKESGEQCDDGNLTNGDGCSSVCITETSHPSPGGGGGITKDICTNMDCSTSYYDDACGICPSKPNKDKVHQAPNKIGNITKSPYSTELNNAYLRAYNFGITTMPTIQQANIEGNLIRSHMAKMMVEFAALFDRKINTGANCSFTDMKKQSDEMKYYSTLACQLGLMGLDDNGNPAEKFNPSDTVTRAQFGTVLSRLLYGNLYNTQKKNQWYVQHLEALNNAGIMKKIDDPSMKELRGYVMLMMMRAAK